MNMFNKLLVGVALGSVLLGGCTSKVTKKDQYADFLPDYNNLQEVTTTSGQKAMRWVSPSWNPDAYDTVVFKQLELYPAPRTDDRVSLKTLQELQARMTRSAKYALGQKYPIISNAQFAPAGSRTLIIRAAITGVTASNEGMHWYEVVPVAALVGSVSAATGHRDQDTELYIEAELIDGSNGQTVAKVVRKVFGETLKNASQPVTSNDFNVAIKTVSSDLQAFIR
jgi:ribosomal protein L7/L12